MSMYVGDQLFSVINEIVTEPSNKLQRQPSSLLLGVNALPRLPRDMSDRNRTSPFAFTGNKFEFRAVGSSQACARPTMILNTIMADSMMYMADQLEAEIKKGFEITLATSNVVTRELKEHHAIVFNGNGYSEDWVKEAERRGLKNLRTTPEAIAAFTAEKNIEVFEKLKVLSRREVESQQHILYENFSKTVGIEADCMVQMVSGYVVPAVVEYKTRLIQGLDPKEEIQAKLLQTVSTQLSALLIATDELRAHQEKARSFHEDKLHEQATYYRQEIMTAMAKVRAISDSLEVQVDDKLWPFPKYSELLFLK